MSLAMEQRGSGTLPMNTLIVDLYHARQHLTELAPIGGFRRGLAVNDLAQQLDQGNIKAVLTALGRLRPRDEAAQKVVQSVLHYFQNNAHRMRYSEFRTQSLFVGSGVVEAGCKTVIAHRLKQSGMQWTVRGANAIIALRCLQLSGRREEFWEARSAG